MSFFIIQIEKDVYYFDDKDKKTFETGEVKKAKKFESEKMAETFLDELKKENNSKYKDGEVIQGYKPIPWIIPKYVICRSCGYVDRYINFDNIPSIWNDIQCPKCGSDDNENNDNFHKSLDHAIHSVGLFGLMLSESVD